MSKEQLMKALADMPVEVKMRKLETTAEETIETRKGDYRLIRKLIRTHNEAVDGLQAEILEHQIKFISLRSISLNRRMYDKFFDFMNEAMLKATQGKRELDRKQYYNGECVLVFYNVDIKRGNMFQIAPYYHERYYEQHGQKDAYFGPKFGATKK
jgi:hypothetical protein